MGVRVLHDPKERLSTIYDSVTMTAFGPVVYADADEVSDWLGTLPMDARKMTEPALAIAWAEWHHDEPMVGGADPDNGSG